MKRILIVDDEEDILDLLEYNLRKAGYGVERASDGPGALERIDRAPPDLVVLDVMMPGLQGTEVLGRLRAKESTRNLPVILLTARGEETDILDGFGRGADDYVTKPFSPRQLLARINAVLNRTTPAAPARLAHGALELDLDAQRVWINGAALELARQEFKLLAFLAAHPNRVYTRDALLREAWDEDVFVEPRTVDVHIRRLRSRLEKTGADAGWIETVRGSGYRFNPDPVPSPPRG